jgi:hypothetical protein
MRSLHIRYLVIDALMRSPSPLSLDDLVVDLHRGGHDLGPPASARKHISDLLRSDLGRGRVVRVGRGVYRLGTVPVSTGYRIRAVARTLDRAS